MSHYRIAMYDHCMVRLGSFAKALLKGFSGYLQTDDFGGYNKVENVIRVGCHAYARGYFIRSMRLIKNRAP